MIFLMYHELEIEGRPLCQTEPGYVRYVLPVSQFEAQMRYLKAHGWHGLSVSAALGSSAERSVALTFDDGTETDLLAAAPMLCGLGFEATFYVVAGWLGRTGHLSTQQLKELHALGFEVGCHSMTHPFLSGLDDAGLQYEIVESKSRLEEILGCPVIHFSCPGGRCNQRVADWAQRAGYKTLSTSEIHTNSVATNRFALGRVVVMRGATVRDVESACEGRTLWKMALGQDMRASVRKILGNSLYDRLRTAALR